MKSYTSRDTVSDEQLKTWLELKKNVLFYGDHGVGKTTMIKDSWDKLGLKSAFFSGSTLDPWVDLIGIPKIVGRGKSARIEFALPQTIDEDLEAIFFDEFNRSPAAVRNAVLELIQFKSINGRLFPNLKVVWAAANSPDSDNNYDVEQIDPAQEDRFHVIVKLSGKPCLQYFTEKYGEEVAKGSLKWHENLPEEIKKLISPRRLDYALDYVLNDGGEARDVLPDERINISMFTRSIRGNAKLRELLKLRKEADTEGLKKFFTSQKNVQPCLKDIIKNYDLSNAFIEYGDKEEVMAYATSDEPFSILVYQESSKNEDLKKVLNDYRKIHSKNPAWFENAHKTTISSRAALDHFLENKDSFVVTRTSLKVGDLITLLNFKSPEEIVDEINCMDAASLYDIDEDSAQNILNFFSRIDLKDFNDRNRDSQWIKKTYSLIYSAFNFFYERDANLVGASFAVKGCEKVATAPPFGLKIQGATGKRGAFGKVSVRDEELQ